MAIKDVMKTSGTEPGAVKLATETKPEQVIMAQSKEDLFLRQLMGEASKEPEEWYAGKVEIDEQFKSMFRLPNELCKGHPKQATDAKERAYCWVEVSDERVARFYHGENWIPVNRTNHAFLPDKYFSALGAIERHGYSRHILMWQPKGYNIAKRRAAAKASSDRLKDSKEKIKEVEKSGAVHLEEVSNSGGYGLTPGSDPVQVDWDGTPVETSTDDE